MKRSDNRMGMLWKRGISLFLILMCLNHAPLYAADGFLSTLFIRLGLKKIEDAPETKTFQVKYPFYMGKAFSKVMNVSMNNRRIRWDTKGDFSGAVFKIEEFQKTEYIKIYESKAHDSKEFQEYAAPANPLIGYNRYQIIMINDKGKPQVVASIDYYNPINVYPKVAMRVLYLSKSEKYEIYNQEREMVLSGEGHEINIYNLEKGLYFVVIGNSVHKFYKT